MSRYVGLAGGAIIEHKLVQHGVKHVFGYSGGAILPALDGLYGSSVEFIQTANEQCAGHIAEGYAKASGKPGMIMTTSGPGTTNLITPFQDALNDTVPMIAFTGQVPTTAMGTCAFQECPTIELTRPCTKWAYQLKNIDELPSIIDKAFFVAQDGKKGPVVIDLPKDVISDTIKSDNIPEFVPPTDKPHLSGPRYEGDIDAIVNLLNGAKRPIIIAGNGCLHCPDELKELAEKANCPVTTTLHGMGAFDELHPLSMQMLGMHGAAYANLAVQAADLIIGIGYRFDDRTTGVISKYAPEARKAEAEGRGGIIHFDIEPSQIDKVIKTTHSVVGDAEYAMKDMIPLVEFKERRDWMEQIQEWREENPFSYQKHEGGCPKTQEVIHAIYNHSKHLQPFVSTGVGNHQMMSCQFFRWTKPRQILSSGSLGTMGVGLPFAIGAQFAFPDQTCIVIDGDGSFNMTNSELYSIAKYNLPVKIAIMNDSRQQMVYVWQKLFFDKRYIGTDNSNPDYCKLAEAWGIPSVYCDSSAGLDAAVDKWLNTDGPCLAEFKVVPDICLPMVAPGKALDEMIINRDNNMNSVRILSYVPKDGLAPS
jgi:acetolactate synthase-1/2/3 large subunit